MSPHMTNHEYCSNCLFLFEESKDMKCPKCNSNRYEGNKQRQEKKKVPKAYFIELDWQNDIAKFFACREFWDALHIRFSHIFEPGVYKDIYDGSEYQLFSEFLSKIENVSFSFNTDGVPIFKSSLFTVWHIWLTINELPPTTGNIMNVKLFRERERECVCVCVSPLSFVIRLF
eukprot:Lithocolla_globosa_v1_NODE_2510_length_1968_cov_96.830110.p1 type:complete len:173 gc:universal NODE_2510_length_1968_cov_96.830110:583-1101(+)